MKRFLFTLMLVSIMAVPSLACSIGGSGPTGKEAVKYADLILHVVAKEYATAPKDNIISTMADPNIIIRFTVNEVVKGKYSEKEILIPGYLFGDDDYNDSKTVPYDFVRPGGRSGSCFAAWYKQGGYFLLLLRKTTKGSYSPYWYALGPVNEQIRVVNDPWFVWVKGELKKK